MRFLTSLVYEVDDPGFADWLLMWTCERALGRSLSVYSLQGSRLERMVPEKRTGSWGTMAKRRRRIRELDCGDVDSVNQNPAGAGVGEAAQGQSKG